MSRTSEAPRGAGPETARRSGRALVAPVLPALTVGARDISRAMPCDVAAGCKREVVCAIFGVVAADDGSPMFLALAACGLHAEPGLRWALRSALAREDVQPIPLEALADLQREGVESAGLGPIHWPLAPGVLSREQARAAVEAAESEPEPGEWRLVPATAAAMRSQRQGAAFGL